MKKLTHLFTQTELSWKKTLILAVVFGIIPGVLMIPEILEGTSLQSPGVTFEFWIFMALFIILNCRSPLEAGLKTFVFFLISQPLIYLIQVPFSPLHWQLFGYYPKWGIYTLCTLPGGMLAWYTKKGNLLSVVILSAANAILCFELPDLAVSMAKRFPYMTLTALFILAELVFFVLLLIKDRKLRIAAFAIIVVMAAACFIFRSIDDKSVQQTVEIELEGEAPFEVLTEYEGTGVSIDGNKMTVNMDFFMTVPIDIKTADGEIITVEVIYGEDGVTWEYIR